ncbi:MAG: hypothetical protein FJY97_02150 [candidate division Zixibacteria bacterium]|nr:hypothetical protein [candidate division Zixibacteria bacterium]
MEDATRTLFRLPFTLTVAGLEGRWLPPDPGLQAEWQGVLRQAENRVGQVMNEVMWLSDRLQKGGLLTGLQGVMKTAESLLSDQTDRLVWQEVQNRMDAFGAFAYPETSLRRPTRATDTLPELAVSAGELDPYTSVWVMEGTGHKYMQRHLREGRLPRNVLREERTQTLPDRALIPFHAGMGLAIAEHSLASVSAGSSRHALRQALRDFVEWCRSNARDGYTGVSLEALGLVARTLRPELITSIDRTLTEEDTDLLALFWHGVGRGLYFLPMRFLPYTGSATYMIDLIRQEAPHRLALENLTAGFAWPVTLVNIRHPDVIEGYVRDGFGRSICQEAFAQGMVAALMTWVDCSPEEVSVQTLLEHRPDASETATAAFWTDQIVERGADAVKRVYPALKKTGQMHTLFRYHNGKAW